MVNVDVRPAGLAANDAHWWSRKPLVELRRPLSDLSRLVLNGFEPAGPYVAAWADTRVVTPQFGDLAGWGALLGPASADRPVRVRPHRRSEVIVAHQGRDGVREVARHLVSTPGNLRLDLSHYPPRPASTILDHRPAPRTPAEAAFLALGLRGWLVHRRGRCRHGHG